MVEAAGVAAGPLANRGVVEETECRGAGASAQDENQNPSSAKDLAGLPLTVQIPLLVFPALLITYYKLAEMTTF